jgi:hypothetical protein
MDPLALSRLDAIASFPWEALEYQRWLEHLGRAPGTGADDYLFSDERARFEPRDTDALVALEGIRVTRQGSGARLRLDLAATDLAVPGVSDATAARILHEMDGTRTLAELGQIPDTSLREVAEVVKATFGVLVFAPVAVADLERRISGIEITRFPGSPYEIVRPYWENMRAVRALAEAELKAALADVERTVDLLRRLHVLALMGEDLQTFYRPASRISSKGIAPGAFLTSEARTLDTPSGTLFLSGPRVNVSLIGGDQYHRALYTSLGDAEAAEGSRELRGEAGLEWGRIVTARASGDEGEAPWFCPPRPVRPEHWEGVVSALFAAREADGAQVVEELAHFHQRFIRLHPFRCANQSLAMNLVNLVLNESHGAGMPHHVLDHLALRLSEAAYARVFATAVEGYLLTEGGPVLRYQELRERRQRGYAFIPRVNACGSIDEALELARAHPEDARLALFPRG